LFEERFICSRLGATYAALRRAFTSRRSYSLPEARRRSLKSFVIICRHLFKGGREGVRRLAQFANSNQSLANGTALPIAVGFCLLFLWVGDATNRFVHSATPWFDTSHPFHDTAVKKDGAPSLFSIWDPRSQNRDLGHPCVSPRPTAAALALRLSVLRVE
jgi:hypothetical protein